MTHPTGSWGQSTGAVSYSTTILESFAQRSNGGYEAEPDNQTHNVVVGYSLDFSM